MAGQAVCSHTPTTWLNQKRWEDDVDLSKGFISGKKKKQVFLTGMKIMKRD